MKKINNMKKVLVMLFLIANVVSVYSQTLKGYTLGSKYYGSVNSEKVKTFNTIVTVANIKGKITIATLKDKTIVSIMFSPVNKYNVPIGNTEEEIKLFVESVEKHYGVSLITDYKSAPKYYPYDYGIRNIDGYSTKDGMFSIKVEKGMGVRFNGDYLYNITFYIRDPSGFEKYLEEMRDRMSDSF
jgi:hypothetical protein